MAERISLINKQDIPNAQRHIARYNAVLNFCQNKVVADLACGTGYGSFLMSFYAKEVIGVDISREAIDESIKNFSRNNITYYIGKVDNPVGIPDLKVDLVVSFETIEHLENINEFKKVIDKILNKNGLFVFSVPLNEPEGFNPYHKHTFTIDKVRSLFPYKRVGEYFQNRGGINIYPFNDDFKDKRGYLLTILTQG